MSVNSVNKKAQSQVSNPSLAPGLERAKVDIGDGSGVPLGNIDNEGNYGLNPQMPVAPDPQAINNSLMSAQSLLQKIADSVSHLIPGQPTSENPLLHELGNVVNTIGNPALKEKMEALLDIYRSNPIDSFDSMHGLINQMHADITALFNSSGDMQASYKTERGNIIMSKRANEKTANVKEEVRQHFNNFAVSDIQIINKLQFLNSMINVDDSPPEQPREYGRPKLGADDEKFTSLHGTGGVGFVMTDKDVKAEIKALRKILIDERGYTEVDVDECVNIINENQRSQIDIGDEDNIGSREDSGYSDREKELMKGINKEAGDMEKVAEISGLSVGPTSLESVWCPKVKMPVESYLCWETCIDGIRIGEKVVCGKRIFDAMVADNNERALRRSTVFAHDNADAVISGPNYRLEDGKRRGVLEDEEIPTERRLQELQKTKPFKHDTTEWTHSPTLSDDKDHDWSQKTIIASKGVMKKSGHKRFIVEWHDMFGSDRGEDMVEAPNAETAVKIWQSEYNIYGPQIVIDFVEEDRS